MKYDAGSFIISSEDVVLLIDAAWRLLKPWIVPSRHGAASARKSPPDYAAMAAAELSNAWKLLGQEQVRAAGALAGVALEFHLKHVARTHGLSVARTTSIIQIREMLRVAGVLQYPHRKLLTRLATMRNRCVHAQPDPPSRAMVERLMVGVELVVRTLR